MTSERPDVDGIDPIPEDTVRQSIATELDPPVPPDASGSTEPLPGGPGSVEERLNAALALADARLGDLHRERAEFVNFRRRTERDLAAATTEGMARLVEALLPVLDDVSLAREHGDLDGTPFAAIADKLDATLGRFGVGAYGEVGDAFDPAVHEALLHEPGADGIDVATCVRVLQPGYRIGERVIRPARVAVAEPG
ncbi:MAG: nucleotide exchange factor GrpE [Kineosporiaceae bacterium]